MYEVAVSYEGSFDYKVKSANYEIKVGLAKTEGTEDSIAPPALLLASVGSCMAVYLERYLNSAKIKFDKFSINVKSDIGKESPRYLRVIEVNIDIMPLELDGKRQEALLEFIKNCPVHNTLLNKPEVRITLT